MLQLRGECATGNKRVGEHDAGGTADVQGKNGDLLVPRLFVIPSDDTTWPSVAWGFKLGFAVKNLRRRLKTNEDSFSTTMTSELVDLDFVRDVRQHNWDVIFMPALRLFSEVYGNTDVLEKFVVPSDADWPRLAWGVRLGATTYNIRCSKAYTAQVAKSKEELRKLKFCFETAIAERDWTEKILPSFEVYRQEFGHCIIESSFKVVRDNERLKSLGFAWNRSKAVWDECIIPAIQTYVEIYKDCKISFKFVIPSEDPWPKNAWTMKLGRTLADMRCRPTYFSCVGRDAELLLLDELDLNLKFSARAWKDRVVPLLEIYKALFGEEDIRDDFVVPSEDAWPERAWGIRLGLIVARNSHHVPPK